jgi:hypothetical protein
MPALKRWCLTIAMQKEDSMNARAKVLIGGCWVAW